jgi:hypothetical protein
MILIFYKDSTMTKDQITSAISQATINGNFNSDLIADLNLRKLAIQQYINKTCENAPNSALAPFVAEVTEDSLEASYKVYYTLVGDSNNVIEKSFKFTNERDSFVESLFDNPEVDDIKIVSSNL